MTPLPQVHKVDPEEVATLYDLFTTNDNVPQVLSTFKRLCHILEARPSTLQHFLEQLRDGLTIYPKARRMMDELYSVAVDKGCIEVQSKWNACSVEKRDSFTGITPNCCSQRKILIVGGGPSGLRMALEARLLGAKVVVLEKRRDFTRYNIVHLWQQAVIDLQAFKPRIFCQDLCSGSHNTINSGWRAKVSPAILDVEEFEFDVLIDASGKRNLVYEIDTATHDQSLGNKRAVRTMIAVAVNFANSGQIGERYPEVNGISGYLTNSERGSLNFASRLQQKGYGVEAIAYLRRETHYFIFTIKNNVIKDKHLIHKDFDSLKSNLVSTNINKVNLENYVLDVANELLHMAVNGDETEEAPRRLSQFHKNEDGKTDVNIFGFEALSCASNSSKILERKGKMLFLALVGDSLTSPFWPEGTGIVKGFMSALDTCWVLKLWSCHEKQITPLQILSTKEFLYSHLRYMDKKGVNGSIFKTCEGKQIASSSRKMFPATNEKKCDPTAFTAKLDPWCRYNRCCEIKKNYAQLIQLYDTDVDVYGEKMENEILFQPHRNWFRQTKYYGSGVILDWYNELFSMLKLSPVKDLSSSWTNGITLLAVISRWAPGRIDWGKISDVDEKNIQRAINIIASKWGIPPLLSSCEMARLTKEDEGIMANYLEKIMQFITSNFEYLIVDSTAKYGGTASKSLKRPIHCFPKIEKTIGTLEKFRHVKNKIGDCGVDKIDDGD